MKVKGGKTKEHVLCDLGHVFKNSFDIHKDVEEGFIRYFEEKNENGDWEYYILSPYCVGYSMTDMLKAIHCDLVKDIIVDPWCDDECRVLTAIKIVLKEPISDWEPEDLDEEIFN